MWMTLLGVLWISAPALYVLALIAHTIWTDPRHKQDGG